MNQIISKLKDNPHNEVKKSVYECPLCNGSLYTCVNTMRRVCDGNMIFHCENIKEHKFWRNPREDVNILHLNENASPTDFHSDIDFKFVDGVWENSNKRKTKRKKGRMKQLLKDVVTLKKLQKELKPYKGTLVIDISLNVVLLMDVEEDEDDFYWVYYDDKTKKAFHSSCVCGWVPLKGVIGQKDYDRMVGVWNLNNKAEAI